MCPSAHLDAALLLPAHMVAFRTQLVAGRQPTVSLSTNLTIVDAPAWDGGEFVPEVIEEEFDLSDLDDVDLDDEPTKDEL